MRLCVDPASCGEESGRADERSRNRPRTETTNNPKLSVGEGERLRRHESELDLDDLEFPRSGRLGLILQTWRGVSHDPY